jgi:hypothetical protein
MRDDSEPQGMYLPDDYSDPRLNLPEDDPQAEAIVAEAVELASAVLKIAADYNVRDMSPDELAEMSRRLYYAGAIGLAEHAVLSNQPHLLDDFDADAGCYRQLSFEPERKRDLLAEWRENLRILIAANAGPETIALTSSLAELLESFQPLEDP